VGAKMAEWEEKEGGGTRPSMRTIHHQSSPVTLWTTLPLSRQSRDGRRTNQLSRLLSLLLLLLLLLLFTTILPSCQLVIQPGPPFQLIPWTTTTTTTTIHRFLVSSSSFTWWWLLSVDFVSQLFLRGFGRDVLVDWVNGFHGKCKSFPVWAYPVRFYLTHIVLLVFIVVPFVLLKLDHKARGECQEHGLTFFVFWIQVTTTIVRIFKHP
jgi:hypothetical protein